MTELINYYVKNELIPFSLTIGWNTKKIKKSWFYHQNGLK